MTMRRSLESSRTIPLLGIVAILSLVMSTYVVVRFAQAQSQREQERIAADASACARGNTLRVQVIALGDADQDMVRGILDVVLPPGQSERIDEIRADLEPVLAEHQARIDEIELTDCAEAVPGISTTDQEDS